MFAKIFVLCGLLAMALGAPVQPEPVEILSQTSNVDPDGSFQWGYESGDGTSQHQTAHVQGAGEQAVQTVEGDVHWVDKEGAPHDLSYVAGPDGVQVQGSDVPVPPPIPAGIQKALEWNAAHPEQDTSKPVS